MIKRRPIHYPALASSGAIGLGAISWGLGGHGDIWIWLGALLVAVVPTGFLILFVWGRDADPNGAGIASPPLVKVGRMSAGDLQGNQVLGSLLEADVVKGTKIRNNTQLRP